jgi:hypothetical protein
MINIQLNKFNTIHELVSKDINYFSIIKNYLENYLESDIHICHPDYIYQIVWNNKVNIYQINQLFDNAMSNLLIQKKLSFIKTQQI